MLTKDVTKTEKHHHIPDSILDTIAKVARNFFWHKDINNSGLPLVGGTKLLQTSLKGG